MNPSYSQVQGNSSIGNSPGQAGMQGQFTEQGFDINNLLQIVNNATISAQNKLQILQARRSSISIADMFDMQMLMNHLGQLSEMSSSVVSASNSAIMTMARGVKG